MSLNKVIILGRLGKEPELRYTPSGSAVCSFPVATSEVWTDKQGQKQEKTEWHKIIVWGKMGEVCNQYLAKGRQVFLEGKLQTRSWDDQSGQKRYTTEITATNVQFIGDRSTQNTYAGNEQREQGQSAPVQQEGMMEREYTISNDASFTADDVPF